MTSYPTGSFELKEDILEALRKEAKRRTAAGVTCKVGSKAREEHFNAADRVGEFLDDLNAGPVILTVNPERPKGPIRL